MWTETFATLIDRKLLAPSSGTAYVAVQRDFLVALLAPALSAIHLGADRYLAHSPDVAAAERAGTFASARAHFYQDDYRKGRRPTRSLLCALPTRRPLPRARPIPPEEKTTRTKRRVTYLAAKLPALTNPALYPDP